MAGRIADQLEDHDAQVALVEDALGATAAAEAGAVAAAVEPEFPGGVGLAMAMKVSVH
jgi:hypothetical protein